MFSHQEGDERCMFISHQRNNISFNLLSLRVPVHTNVLLHRPLRRAVDVNNRKFFNIEFFERLSFITRTIISRVSWVMSKENLSLVNSKLQPRGYIKSILTEEYYTVSKPAKSQNKNKARQVGSTS